MAALRFKPVQRFILVKKKKKVLGSKGHFKWFKSYLFHHNQCVKIDEVESSMETITCGVPQGPTLGPLLFLLYINDLPNPSEKLSFRIFADDTNIFFTSNNTKEVEFTMNELTLVLKYCTINNLSENLTVHTFLLAY